MHISVSPTTCTTREGNWVSQSRLPVSLRQCPGGPSATTCGHHRWDWALPHGSRKQRTHSTPLYSITVTNSVRIKSAFYAPPGAHQSSVPDKWGHYQNMKMLGTKGKDEKRKEKRRNRNTYQRKKMEQEKRQMEQTMMKRKCKDNKSI